MRVIVISLRTDARRRLSATTQLDKAGVSFEFFDAIAGGPALRHGYFEHCEEREFLLNTGRNVVEGEIGCFASHRELWKRCVETGEPMLIMEDDFSLGSGFADAVRCSQDIVDVCGFVRLQSDLREPRRAVKRLLENTGRFVVSRYMKAPHGTICYCISPAVAERFVHATRTIDAPVDVFIKKFWQHEQPLYALTPYTVSTSELSYDSRISGRVRHRKPWAVKVHRFARKIDWHWHRLMFNLRFENEGSNGGV